MYRVRFLAIAACGVALTACSSGSDLFKSAPQQVTLRFESEPQGAEVKTSTGQTCRTPCALAVPGADLTISFALNGYQPQTVPVKFIPAEPNYNGAGALTPARFDPDPVTAELAPAKPTKKRAPARKPAPKRAPASAAAPNGQTGAPAPAAPAARAAPARTAAPAPAAASPWPPAPPPAR